jgi:bifunctional UDP-N-acetylglucosamine pyrophosphorylase / glucosamine-1-phosphate N-acetyltransferase
MSICAVIPAAGRGTRLGTDEPKILTQLREQDTIWSILYGKLAPLVEHIHLVLSPHGASVFPPLPATVTYSIQSQPLGMGDAIFSGHEFWSQYDAILVVWGDQIFVSKTTLARSIAALADPDRHLVLPLTRMVDPYVQYVFEGSHLTKILMTREGDIAMPNGLCDVGTFLLGTAGLKALWEEFLGETGNGHKGRSTGEINFLPFLPFLSAKSWRITPIEVEDALEARGINTKDDLAFFKSLYNGTP